MTTNPNRSYRERAAELAFKTETITPLFAGTRSVEDFTNNGSTEAASLTLWQYADRVERKVTTMFKRHKKTDT